MLESDIARIKALIESLGYECTVDTLVSSEPPYNVDGEVLYRRDAVSFLARRVEKVSIADIPFSAETAAEQDV